MINQEFEGKYFDGKSSASNPIDVTYFKSENILRLLFADGEILDWQGSDISPKLLGNHLELRNKNFPGTLVVVEENAAQPLYQVVKSLQPTDIHDRILGLGFSKMIVLAIFLLGLIVLGYFFLLPPLAEKSVALIPESFDVQLGSIAMNAVVDYSEINEEKTELLKQFASHLDWGNTKPLQFTVVNSPLVNAFALPDGNVVVYTGIVKGMESPEQLAALLGHEASHVNQRHSMKILSRNLAGYVLVSLLLSDVNGMMTIFIDNAQQLHSLSYSRKFEQEADELGLRLLMSNQVDPRGMVKLFEQLGKEEISGIPDILSSHPLTEDRKKHMDEIIEESDYTLNPSMELNSIFLQIKENL